VDSQAKNTAFVVNVVVRTPSLLAIKNPLPSPPRKGEGARQVSLVRSVLVLCALSLFSPSLQACPFCPALEPTLAQLREDSAVCLLGEARAATVERKQPFLVQQRFKGDGFAPQSLASIPLSKPLPAGELRLLFGEEPSDAGSNERAWTLKPAEETLLAYFARAPQPRQPSKDRLRYFAKYLEHPDQAIAADALMEFAHADLPQVREIVDAFSSAEVRTWLADAEVRPERKGFYGLLLGLLAQENPRERAANRALLEQFVFTPGNDYRAGHDGMIAGYLLAGGKNAFAELHRRLLTVPEAPPGDLKHAVAALRFYYEYGAADLRPQVVAAMTLLAERPVTAAAAIVDLTRWQAWSELPRIVAMYEHPQTDTVIKRAVVGFLRRAPEPGGKAALDKLRAADPAGVVAAEAILDKLMGKE
jgi:hypothetical protein